MKIKDHKLALVSSVVILVLAGAGAFYYFKHKSDNQPQIDPVTGGAINYGPPTAQDTADINNEVNSDQQAQDKYTKPKGKSVTPVIVSYGQTKDGVEVSARVPGIVEDGGTCTLTLTKGSDKVTASKKAVSNVSEVSCGFITISNSKLSPGNWSATVSYSSDKYTGTSDKVTVEVK